MTCELKTVGGDSVAVKDVQGVYLRPLNDPAVCVQLADGTSRRVQGSKVRVLAILAEVGVTPDEE